MIDDFQQHLQQAKKLLEKQSGSFFWGGAERSKAVEQIAHLVSYSQLLLLVTGSTGSGKTFILQHAEQALKEQCRCCFITATPMMNASQLFTQLWKRLVDQTLPSSANTPEALLFAVRDVLLSEQQAVVLIDDALLLDVDALRLLVTLAIKANEHTLPIHFVISGGEVLASKLQKCSQLSNADLLYTIHLNQLTLEETADYLRQYLKVTATEDVKELTTTDLDKIHKQAQGNFSKLNMLVDEALARKMDKTEPSNLGLPKGHLYAIGIVASSLLLLLLVNSLFFSDTTDVAQTDEPLSPKTTTEIPLWDEEVTIAKPELPIVEAPSDQVAESTVVTIENVTDTSASASQQETSISNLPDKTSESVTGTPKPQDNVLKEERLNKIQPKQTKKVITPEETALEKTAIENKKTEVVKPKPKQQVTSQQAKKVIAPKVKTPVAKAPSKQQVTTDARWYIKQSKSQFVLQILGVSSSNGAKAFINQNRAAGNLKYFRTRYKGKPWYVVTIGLYPNRDAALVAARQLPPKIRQQKPWPRSIANVQAEIRKDR